MKTPALQIVMAFLAAAGVLLHSLGGTAGVVVCLACDESECAIVAAPEENGCCSHEETDPEPGRCVSIAIKGDAAPRASLEKDRAPALEFAGIVAMPDCGTATERHASAWRAEARGAPPPRESPARALILLV